jgi:hypothetical protein
MFIFQRRGALVVEPNWIENRLYFPNVTMRYMGPCDRCGPRFHKGQQNFIRFFPMPKTPARNTLFYGDNLPILREHIGDESVDLVYLDPPFNSNASYNVLFRAPDGHQSQAQIEAFDDTWHWNERAERAFDDEMQSGNSDAAEMLRHAVVSQRERHDGLSCHDGCAALGAASRAEAHGLALSPLRSDREPLLEDSFGCGVRADRILQRTDMEANQL